MTDHLDHWQFASTPNLWSRNSFGLNKPSLAIIKHLALTQTGLKREVINLGFLNDQTNVHLDIITYHPRSSENRFVISTVLDRFEQVKASGFYDVTINSAKLKSESRPFGIRGERLPHRSIENNPYPMTPYSDLRHAYPNQNWYLSAHAQSDLVFKLVQSTVYAICFYMNAKLTDEELSVAGVPLEDILAKRQTRTRFATNFHPLSRQTGSSSYSN